MTKYDAFRANRDSYGPLKYNSKSIQMSLILVQRPPKPYKLLMFAHFKEYHGNHKNFKSLHDFGGCCLTIADVCMDFEPYFKVQ